MKNKQTLKGPVKYTSDYQAYRSDTFNILLADLNRALGLHRPVFGKTAAYGHLEAVLKTQNQGTRRTNKLF